MRIKVQIVAAGLLSAFLLGLCVPLLSQTSTSAGGSFQPIQDYTVGVGVTPTTAFLTGQVQ